MKQFALSIILVLLLSVGVSAYTVTADFSINKGVNPVNGISGGITADKPTDDMIKPLRLGMGRDCPGARLASLGIADTEVIGPNASGPEPYKDFAAYEAGIKRYMDEHNTPNPQGVFWEVWDEPNGETWHGTREQYLETYKHAYKVIRENSPKALIAGPSPAFFDKAFFQQFFDYCLANNLEVNVVTWHEKSDKDIPGIPDRVDYIKQTYMNDPKYESLKIRQIHINQAINGRTNLSPGENAAYLYYMERSGVDKATRAWVADKENVVADGRLAGMLTPDSKPTALWWLYKVYADGVDWRVYGNTGSDPNTVILASGGDAPQVILGRIGIYSGLTTLRLKGLRSLPKFENATKLVVKIKRIPDTQDAAMQRMPDGASYNATLPADGVVAIDLMRLDSHWSYVFYLSAF